MEKFKEKINAFWLKTKAYMSVKWMGAPRYVWLVLLPLVVLLLIIGFLAKRPKKTRV